MGMNLARVSAGERNRAIATLLLAFSADPVMRWMYPEPERYVNAFPALLLAFGGQSFTEETVWRLDDLLARPGQRRRVSSCSSHPSPLLETYLTELARLRALAPAQLSAGVSLLMAASWAEAFTGSSR